jgi:ABC-2 type transport system permease protein
MTAMSDAVDAPRRAALRARPSDLALAAWQVAYEQRAFWRNRARAFLSIGMPIVLLLIFGSLNHDTKLAALGGIPYVAFFLPGILAYGIILTQFMNLAGGIAVQRDSGLLKRMRGLPLPGWAYVGGRVGSTIAVSLLAAVVMLVLGAALYGVDVRAEAIPAILITVLLGAATFAALGIACVQIIPNAEAAPVVANVLILPLTFISGVWYPMNDAPHWLVEVAKLFPIEHLAHALQTAVDPLNHGSAFAGNDLLALAVWLAIGTRLALRFWRKEAAR